MNSTNPSGASSIADFIAAGNGGEFTYSGTSILVKLDNGIIFPYQNILDKYLDILKVYGTTIALTDAEFQEYKYRPKKLSLKLYGTIELWFLILRLNGLLSVTEFDLQKVIVFNPSNTDVLNKILMKEKEFLEKNRSGVMA